MDERTENEKPWWDKIVWLFVAFGIAAAIRFGYKEIFLKKEIPIESMKTEWRTIGPTTLTYDGKSYAGDMYFDKLSLKKEEGKITIWIKILAHNPVTLRAGNESLIWDEGVQKWIVDCKEKEIEMDYMSLYRQGRKQFSGKTDVKFSVVKGTFSYDIYEAVCF